MDCMLRQSLASMGAEVISQQLSGNKKVWDSFSGCNLE